MGVQSNIMNLTELKENKWYPQWTKNLWCDINYEKKLME